ncbi:hypothetical protein KORDIASMS9_03736 [Kordia sp. SMS9]|nr:hypothetical protein KORDIASMS9_03736 [Kordia sp. SMS9]
MCQAFPHLDRSENNSTRVFYEKKGRETQIKRIRTSNFAMNIEIDSEN